MDMQHAIEIANESKELGYDSVTDQALQFLADRITNRDNVKSNRVWRLNCEKLEAENARLREELAAAQISYFQLSCDFAVAQKGLNSVLSLINESCGVAGLHLNGEVALWDELRSGGRFEGWLAGFDAAIAAEKGEQP